MENYYKIRVGGKVPVKSYLGKRKKIVRNATLWMKGLEMGDVAKQVKDLGILGGVEIIKLNQPTPLDNKMLRAIKWFGLSNQRVSVALIDNKRYVIDKDGNYYQDHR